jgi:hypothetical protein
MLREDRLKLRTVGSGDSGRISLDASFFSRFRLSLYAFAFIFGLEKYEL